MFLTPITLQIKQ